MTTQAPARRKFSPEEDAALRGLVNEYGTDQWPLIAGQMPGRSVRQCRERWKHYVSGDKLWAPWTATEDAVLRDKVAVHGQKWTKVTRFLRGRTDLEAKTRWKKLVLRDAREPEPEPEPELQQREVREEPEVVTEMIPERVVPVTQDVDQIQRQLFGRETDDGDWFGAGMGWEYM